MDSQHRIETEAVEAVVRAVDLGINWVDTAPVYGNGKAEELVGRALLRLGPSRRPIVATKCGRLVQPDGSVTGIIKRDSIFREVEASLQRLGVDVVDLYQMHWPDPDEDIEEAWTAMCDLRQQGKVRYIGVSNFNVQQLKRIATIGSVTSLQPPYSMIVRDVERDILSYCEAQQIGVVTYSPMYKGLLTGAFDEQRIQSLETSDHRLRDPRFQAPQIEHHLRLVARLRPIAKRNNRSLAQLAIAWVLRHQVITAAIVGARRPEQIEGTVAAADWELSTDDVGELETLLAQHSAELVKA